ncbi:MAG: sensor histidine kinase [Rubrobacteraceae bacterium]
MNLGRVRLRLTLGYVGVFALIISLLGAVMVVGFSVELVSQEDELLRQEARNQAANILGDERREVLSDGSTQFSWIHLDTQGRVQDRDPVSDSLGLPDDTLAEEALRDDASVSATIQGDEGRVRAVSMPMYDESGELVGVIQYARTLRDVGRAVNGLVLVLIPLGIGALGLAAIGGQFMAGRAVRPVRESFERQREFIADASHELKTPLTLIRADAEVLGRGLKNPEDRKLTDDVLSETDRMSGILSDLLLMARLDAGKLPVKREPFDLSGAISDVTGRFSSRASSSDIQLKAPASGKLRAVGDRERTEQILAILLDNAIRHTPAGGAVTVAGRERGGFVEAVVEDSGPGVPPEQLPRIFERFYRSDTSRSRESGGTGLGLAIARDLARAQKGDLEAGNAPDGGATFNLELPAG